MKSHRESAGPLAGRSIVSFEVSLKYIGDFRDKRVVRVAITHKRADWKQNLRDGERRRPLVLEYIETDRTVAIDVAVVNFGRKSNFRGLEGVVGWKVNGEKEDSLVVRRVLGSHNRRNPVELLSVVWGPCRAVGRWVSSEVDKLFLNSFKCHFLCCINLMNQTLL